MALHHTAQTHRNVNASLSFGWSDHLSSLQSKHLVGCGLGIMTEFFSRLSVKSLFLGGDLYPIFKTVYKYGMCEVAPCDTLFEQTTGPWKTKNERMCGHFWPKLGATDYTAICRASPPSNSTSQTSCTHQTTKLTCPCHFSWIFLMGAPTSHTQQDHLPSLTTLYPCSKGTL